MERRKREAEKDEADAKERARQDAMNAKAYEACVRVWRAVHSNPNVHLAGAEAQALAKRLHNRAELRLVVLEPEAVRRLPPGQFQAMGTNGLSDTELRAVLHALRASKASGA